MSSDHALVRRLLSPAAGAVAREPIYWRRLAGSSYIGVLDVEVANLEISQTRLEVRASRMRPEAISVVYVAAFGWIRRLCVNTEHRPFVGTHKHRIEGGAEDVYEPDDIPAVPISPDVLPQEYPAVIAAFAAECFVSLESATWTHPWEV